MSSDHNPALPFYRRSIEHPRAIALVVDDTSIAYHDLRCLAGGVAGWLLRGKRARRVGILASRSLNAYAGFLGTYWTGAACVPLNPRFPYPYVQSQMRRARIDALIVDSLGAELLRKIPSSSRPKKILERLP